MEPALTSLAVAFARALGVEAADCGFDRHILEVAAAFLERQRSDAGCARLGWVRLRAGALLGECLISAHGGAWIELLDEWAVRLPNGCVVLPFEAVGEHLEHGAECSIVRYYDAVTAVLNADAEWNLEYLGTPP